MLRSIFFYLMSPFKVLLGAARYKLTGRTPENAYQAMIQIFCATKGYGLDLINWTISTIKVASGEKIAYTASTLTADDDPFSDTRGIEFVAKEIRRNGFCVLDKPICDDLLNDILQFGLKTPAKLRGLSYVQIYDRKNPLAVRYDFTSQSILGAPLFNKLLLSRFGYAVSAKYLGCNPWLDVLSLWWHTAFSNEPDSDAAQLYHFDMDRPKWLKVFVYITDVESDSGPHCYISGSHRSGALPYSMLRKGYSRISDTEVYEHFGKSAEREFIGRRGTVIFEDTRGLHKGKHVKSGDRLIFQMQYSNSKFGTYYPSTTIPDSNKELAGAFKKFNLKCTYLT